MAKIYIWLQICLRRNRNIGDIELASEKIMKNQVIVLVLLIVGSTPTFANVIPLDEQIVDARSFGYLDVGLSLGVGKLPLVGFNDSDTVEDSTDLNAFLIVNLEGRLQYKGFFLEVIERSFNGSALGYSFYDDERGSFEFIATKTFGEIERSRIPSLEMIEDREGDVNLGFRHSRYFGKSILQSELVANLTNSHEGFTAAVQIGRSKQVGNWGLNGFFGARYFSARMLDQYFSVSDSEASALFPEYQADDGLLTSIQVDADLPITEKLLFNVSAAFSILPSTVSDSPLAQGDSFGAASIGMTYLIGGR